MEFNKKQPALLFLDKNGFFFYEEGLASVVSLGFAQTVVTDMDIIDGATFVAQIKAFIDQYKLPPAAITIVLSPTIIFEKDIVDLNEEQRADAIKKFIDTIPFESVVSRSYPIEKGVKVLATNDDFYVQLKLGFEKNGFVIDNVVPYQLLGTDQALIKNLTTDNASQFLKRAPHFRQLSLIVERSKPTPTTTTSKPSTTTQPSDDTKPKKANPRLFAMIGIFAVLFIILGFMLFNMN